MKAERQQAERQQAGHRHTAPGQHEHEFEPQYGLPEVLPADEKLLWQGSPDWKTLAIQRFHVRKLVIYFAALLAVRVAFQLEGGATPLAAFMGTLTLFSLAVLAVGLVAFMAWLTARTTVYTLTDKRVVMRIGIVLTLTLNLPYKRVLSAGLTLHAGSAGDLALQLKEGDRVAFLHLWPHARRWRFRQPEPTLLCVPEAQAVAAQLTAAWSTATGVRALPAAAREPEGAMAPQLATR